MRRLMTVLLAAQLVLPAAAAAQSLDDLARAVREAAISEAGIDRERESRFLSERDRQDALLREARQELASENARSDGLREAYDLNERTLADLETT
ncbi:MAG: MotA/TolQ/ExbB proton channel family protein, partial [Xanthomonadales bacterium]|nr:MotA/TolQ/ExbB proton channel family protein [Xanthomonadales bacterium]